VSKNLTLIIQYQSKYKEERMSFRCPICGGEKTLLITAKIELPADTRSDEISLQTIDCQKCGFEGLAVYEESRRGALGSESIDHYGFTLSGDEKSALKRLIRQCPQPTNPNCECDSHRYLNRRDGTGRWIRPGKGEQDGTFPMKI
jgi:predicted RNA-binding Zn-ribbon protein involved in translation (DUF1610 family)